MFSGISLNFALLTRLKGDLFPSFLIETYIFAPTVAAGVGVGFFNLASNIASEISFAVDFLGMGGSIYRPN